MRRTIHYALIALVFVALVSSIEFFLKQYQNSLLKELVLLDESHLSSQAQTLKAVVEYDLSLVASLEAYVNSGYLKNKDDQEIKNYLASLYNGVRSSGLTLLIAPNGVAKYSYPLRSDESSVNWEMLSDPREHVEQRIGRTLLTQQMTIDGPIKMDGGINALIARKAIYYEGGLWGLVSIIIDMDKLLYDSDIKSANVEGDPEDRNLHIAIRYQGQPAFYGNNLIFEKNPIMSQISFLGYTWELSALPQESAIRNVKLQIEMVRIAYLIVLLLGIFFYLYIVRQRNQLSLAVEKRTKELLNANEHLTAANEELLAGEYELQEYTTRLKDSEQMLSYMAYHDLLTGLNNRAHFQEVLKEQIKHTSNQDAFQAVLFFDLDNFKMVNDSHGHYIGDLLLQEVVSRIKQASIPYHTFSRFGGDEFAMLLTHCRSNEDIQQICEQLLDLFKLPFWVASRSFFVGVSIGISKYPEGGTTGEALLKNADIAMYMAKKDSGSSYAFFNRQMEMNSLTKLEMGNHLREALERNELEVFYQPQVDCIQGKIIGMEALLRWKHTSKGYVSPAEFIPLAEEIGMIVPIGEWVLRTACAQMKVWHSVMEEPLDISVNLSVRQLQDERFADKVRFILEETGLEAQYLEMEITENVAMKDEQLGVLRCLRDLGIEISVDDFGTHYSSLSYLKRFPVTKIKLDQSFVRGVQTDDKDRAMIKAIISVANSFQLGIIAEGVETEEQARFLVENGCRQIQGYYFFRPMNAEQVMQVIGESLLTKLDFMGTVAVGKEL